MYKPIKALITDKHMLQVGSTVELSNLPMVHLKVDKIVKVLNEPWFFIETDDITIVGVPEHEVKFVVFGELPKEV